MPRRIKFEQVGKERERERQKERELRQVFVRENETCKGCLQIISCRKNECVDEREREYKRGLETCT